VLLDGLDHVLKLVLLLPRDPDLLAHDLRLHLVAGSLDELRELPGLLVVDAASHVDGLPHRPLRRGEDRTFGQCLEGDVPTDGLLLEHVERRLQPVLRARAKLDRVVVEREGGPRVLEVEPGQDLAAGLVVGVADLLRVHLRDDVERELVLGHES